MKAVLGYVLGAILTVVALFTVCVFLVTGDLWFYKTYAPKYEQARRDTFEQSKAFNDGMAQEFDAMYMGYGKADKEGKAAIASVALHRAASYDTEQLPAHIRAWLLSIRSTKGY